MYLTLYTVALQDAGRHDIHSESLSQQPHEKYLYNSLMTAHYLCKYVGQEQHQ